MRKTLVLLIGLAALAGCAAASPDPTRAALQQTIVPLCGGKHAVSVASGAAVGAVRSECRPVAKPQ